MRRSRMKAAPPMIAVKVATVIRRSALIMLGQNSSAVVTMAVKPMPEIILASQTPPTTKPAISRGDAGDCDSNMKAHWRRAFSSALTVPGRPYSLARRHDPSTAFRRSKGRLEPPPRVVVKLAVHPQGEVGLAVTGHVEEDGGVVFRLDDVQVAGVAGEGVDQAEGLIA